MVYPRRKMSKEAALQVLEENKRWPKGTIKAEYILQAEETLKWYAELEHDRANPSAPADC